MEIQHSLDQVERFAEHREGLVLLGGALQRGAGKQKIQHRLQVLHGLHQVNLHCVGGILQVLRLEQQIGRIAADCLGTVRAHGLDGLQFVVLMG